MFAFSLCLNKWFDKIPLSYCDFFDTFFNMIKYALHFGLNFGEDKQCTFYFRFSFDLVSNFKFILFSGFYMGKIIKDTQARCVLCSRVLFICKPHLVGG